MTLAPFPVPPIVKTVTVRAAPERTFALFAGDFARWGPLSATVAEHEGLAKTAERVVIASGIPIWT